MIHKEVSLLLTSAYHGEGEWFSAGCMIQTSTEGSWLWITLYISGHKKNNDRGHVIVRHIHIHGLHTLKMSFDRTRIYISSTADSL